MKPRAIISILILLGFWGHGLAARAETCKLSIPFEFLAVEPGDTAAAPPVITPTPGRFSFPTEFTCSFQTDEGISSDSGGQFQPIWDHDLSAFPAAELDPWQMYSRRAVYTGSGQGYLHFYVHDGCTAGAQPAVAPGSYTLVAEKSQEYNLAYSILTIIQTGATCAFEVDNDRDGLADGATIIFKLGHVVDSPNYYLFNSHEHAGEWERMPKVARVLRDLGWGGEVWVHSAHFSHNYYEQTLDQMGMGDRNVVLTASEDWPPQGPGHHMVFPQYPFAADPDFYGRNYQVNPDPPCDPFCPLDSTTCQRYCPDIGRTFYGDQEYYTAFRWLFFPAPFHFIHQRDLYREKSGHPVLYVPAHPECGAPGYFSNLLEANGSGKVKETYFARGMWRDDFDALEFRKDEGCRNTLATYYSLLNQGYRFTLVSGNDNHWLNSYIYGHASYVYSDRSPADNDRQAFVDSIITSIKTGHSFISFGPFLQLSVRDQAGSTVIPDALAGDTLDATDGSTYADGDTIVFHLDLQRRWPCSEDYVTAVVNGAPAVAGDPVSWSEIEIMPGQMGCRSSRDYPIKFSRDSWVVFLLGTPTMTYADSVTSIASPVYVEFDGVPGIAPAIARPEIDNVEIKVGATVVSPADPARPGDILDISFDVAPGSVISAVDAWVTPSPIPWYGSTVYVNQAVCQETPAGSRHYRCAYQIKGKYPELDGDANEVRVSVKNSAGYRNWQYRNINIKMNDTDADGLPDWWENAYNLDGRGCAGPGDDCDGDQESNLDEYRRGDQSVYPIQEYRKNWRMGWTNPVAADSDGDQIGDHVENSLSPCLDQNSFDTDLDGLCDGNTSIKGMFWINSDGTNTQRPWDFLKRGVACVAGEDLNTNGIVEPGLETDPCNPDTDNDGITDGWEFYYSHYGDTCATNPLVADALADPDSDSLPNLAEFRMRTNPCLPDTDGDGLTDALEINLWGSDPRDPDSDNDGIPDGDEAAIGMDPVEFDLYDDLDGDSLANLDEYLLGSDPLNPDSDGDSMTDGWEQTFSYCGLDLLAADAQADADAEGVTNGLEFALGTNPCDPDSDHDGLSDQQEIAYGGSPKKYTPGRDTDPLNPDTDADAMDDGWEDAHSSCQLDPLTADAALDPDMDGLNNGNEYTLRTDPCNPDSDADTMPDGYEITYGLDPTTDDALGDLDADGLTNVGEFVIGSNPLNPDTDADTMTDGWEAAASCGLNPLLGDTAADPDGDGLNNISEFLLHTDPCNPDSDADTMPDGYEVLYGLDPAVDDSADDRDNDGLANLDEFIAGTNPNNPDTDGDLMGDGWETAHAACGFDPLTPDSVGDLDGDLLDNIGEYLHNTDPCNPDSDHDTMPDGYEVLYGLDPAVDDSANDRDNDGLANLDEFIAGTNPNNPDTDGDLMGDGWETAHAACGFDPLTPDSAGDLDGDLLDNIGEYLHNTDPCDPDSDHDTMPDGYEVLYGLDPARDDSADDRDSDGLANLDEFIAGTNPNNPDTDGDLMGDGWETAHAACGFDPLTPDSAGDLDGDLLDNIGEYLHNTDPCDPDSDHDGMSDGYEVTCGLDPGADDAAADRDGDGLANLVEFGLGSNAGLVDTDGDLMPDGWERDRSGCGLDLLAGDSALDADLDHASNLAEFLAATDPCDPDSDHDGLDDHLELTDAGCLDPLDPDSDGDGLVDGTALGEDRDNDGLLDPGESDPCATDTDGDGLPDYDEVMVYGTLPGDWDTDHDYLPDGFELLHQGDSLQPLSPLDPSDGASNFDGDQNRNRDEYWNGSSLWGPDPAPIPGLNPACFFWGEGDGDGYPGPADITEAQRAYVGFTMDFAAILPHSYDPLDLDKDGYPGPSDITQLQYMYTLAGRPGGYASTPARLTLVSEPGPAMVRPGDTTHVTVSVASQGPAVVPYSSAFGVMFWVESGSAVLLGGDGTDLAGPPGNRYDISAEAEAGALGNIVVQVTGPGPVVVRARIPACGNYPYGRWSPEINLPDPVIINGP